MHALGILYRRGIGAAALCLLLAVAAGCGGNDSGGGAPAPVAQPTGTVTGKVTSVAVGNPPVNGATVKTSIGTTTTGADGKFTVSAPAGDRTIVHVEANGFAEAFPVARVTSGQTTALGVKLVPVGVTTSVSVASGDTVSVLNSTAQVTIPANGLVPKAGGTPAGSVNVSVTPINPAVDPNLMPGGFTGISAGGGSAQPIESFGALLVDIRDGAGTQYNLASGKTSTIRIPLGTQSANPPATIPLWYFDEAAGIWKEEGTATLQGTAPNQYYEGTVTHFSYWNADKVLERIFVTGCVKDANNQLVANVLVGTEGIDYTGTAYDLIASDGTFKVAMRKNSRAKLGLFEFDLQTFNFTPISNTVTVGPSAVDITLTNCLVKQPGPLTITTGALVGGTVGTFYSQTLAASGGVPGYVWSLNGGSSPLPNGITLNATGLISGTPTVASTTTITAKVTDSTGATKTKDFTLTIVPQGVDPLAITTNALPNGTVGAVYTAQLTTSGGTGAKSWSVGPGTLPAGLTLNPTSGAVSGTPTAAGTATFTVQVQDSGTPQQSAQRQFSVIVLQTGGTGGGSGTLTVSNAPAIVGGTFVVDPQFTSTSASGGVASVVWGEEDASHAEALVVTVADGLGVIVVFGEADQSGARTWACAPPSSGFTVCNGLSVNRGAGSATFTNVVLNDTAGNLGSITLNGTLTFTPF